MHNYIGELKRKIDMTTEEFESEVNMIRARNGWRVEFECCGIWIVRIFDKETNELLGETGSFSLIGCLVAIRTPLDHTIWKGKQ